MTERTRIALAIYVVLTAQTTVIGAAVVVSFSLLLVSRLLCPSHSSHTLFTFCLPSHNTSKLAQIFAFIDLCKAKHRRQTSCMLHRGVH